MCLNSVFRSLKKIQTSAKRRKNRQRIRLPPSPPMDKSPTCKHFFNTLYYPFREIRNALPGSDYSSPKSSTTQFYHAGMLGLFKFSVIDQTLTWTTGSLSCVRDHSYACVYTHGRVGHTDNKSAQHFWLRKKPSHNFFLYSWWGRGLNPWVSLFVSLLNV